MNRRECIAALASTIVTASRLAGQQDKRPTVRLCGMAYVRAEGGQVVVWMPNHYSHRVFVVGKKRTVESLCGDAKKVGDDLRVMHRDILAYSTDSYVGCLFDGVRDIELAPQGQTPGTISPVLAASMPNVISLANAVAADKYSLMPQFGWLRLVLVGGSLVRSTQSKSPGSASDVKWTFYRGGVSVPNHVEQNVTDVADFLADQPGAKLNLKNGDEVALDDDERVWFVNLPVDDHPDDDATTIEAPHIDQYLDAVSPTVKKGQLLAKTTKKISFPKEAKAAHPCDPSLRARWFPPDTDPCFMMSF